MKIFSQYSIMTDKKMIEDSPTQIPCVFFQNASPKKHSVDLDLTVIIKALVYTLDSPKKSTRWDETRWSGYSYS